MKARLSRAAKGSRLQVHAVLLFAGGRAERDDSAAEGSGLGLFVWSPLAGGFRRRSRDNKDAAARRATFDFPPVDKDRYGIVDAMRTVAEGHGVSVAQIALAWIPMTWSRASSLAAELEQLDTTRSVDVALSNEDLKALDEASRLRPEYCGGSRVDGPAPRESGSSANSG